MLLLRLNNAMKKIGPCLSKAPNNILLYYIVSKNVFTLYHITVFSAYFLTFKFLQFVNLVNLYVL